MFDINPAAHAHYLANLERAYAKAARQPAPVTTGRAPMLHRTPPKAAAVLLTLTLAAVFSGAFFV